VLRHEAMGKEAAMNSRSSAYCFTVVLAAVALGLMLLSATNTEAQQRLYVVTSGGAYGDAQQRAFFTPFEKATGIQVVVEKLSPPETFVKLKAMVAAKNVTWDVCQVESRQVFRGALEGVYEGIDYSQLDTNDLFKEAQHPNGVAIDFYTNQLGYRKEAFPNNSQPKTMAELWDVQRFPQPRVLRNQPYPNLEHAMQAIKGSAENLYPLDTAAAFKKMDEIRPKVKVWYVSGSQPGQLLVDNELDLALGNGSRFLDLMRKGAPIGVEWIGSVDEDWWVIPKGSARKTLAMKFIAFVSSARVQADFVGGGWLAGPASRGAFKYIDPTIAKLLPTFPENYARLAKPDYVWWGQNEADLEARWTAWLLKK